MKKSDGETNDGSKKKKKKFIYSCCAPELAACRIVLLLVRAALSLSLCAYMGLRVCVCAFPCACWHANANLLPFQLQL